MYKEELTVKLLSPGFCGGADQNQPEIRAASIRGHLRRWHVLLFNETDMKTVWGSIGKDCGASKIQLRVLVDSQSKKQGVLLPHKTKGAGSRECLNAEFTVFLASRNHEVLARAFKTLEAWSLFGALGTRANRAAGSVWPSERVPSDIQTLRARLKELGIEKQDIRISKETNQADELRIIASDTLSISHLFGSANPRKESPLKIKVIKFFDGMHLLIRAKQPGVVDSALKELKKRNKPLATLNWEKL